MKNIDNKHTNEITCPFCGYKFCNSQAYGSNHEEDLGLIECKKCTREFYTTRHISISYSTKKAQYGTCKKCNANNVVVTNYSSSIGEYNSLCIKCGKQEKKHVFK